MGDGNDRFALHHKIELLLNGGLGFAIKGGGGFVEDQDRRVFQ